MIRLPSQLSDAVENEVERIIGCGIRVHQTLGPGFMETVYRNAFRLELSAANIPFECEKSIGIRYRDVPIATHRVDLIVSGQIIVELKAVSCIEHIHVAQILSYLKATGLKIGLLMNFNATTLPAGLRRIVL